MNEFHYSYADKIRILSKYTNLPAEHFKYNLYVSWKYNYLFTSNLKVACSTLRSRLFMIEENINPEDVVYYGQDVGGEILTFEHNMPLTRIDNVVDINHLLARKDIFKFAFVRNPYTRLLSCYLDKIQSQRKTFTLLADKSGQQMVDNTGNKIRRQFLLSLGLPEFHLVTPSFEEFVDYVIRLPHNHADLHMARQKDVLGKISYDYIGRLEYFDDCWDSIVSALGFPRYNFVNVDYHKTNATDLMSEYYDNSIASKVCAHYAADFEQYDYPKELPL